MAYAFNPGLVVTSDEVRNLMNKQASFYTFVSESLGRHLNGDWGDANKEEQKRNENSANSGAPKPLRSTYKNKEHPEWSIRIVTSKNRDSTAISFAPCSLHDII